MKGPREKNVLHFLFVPDPLVFLSVCQRASSAAMLHCRPITQGREAEEGGGGREGRAFEEAKEARSKRRELGKHDCRRKALLMK